MPGGRTGNNLMVVRSANDLILDWRNGPTQPRRYSLVGADSKTKLADTPAGIGSDPVLVMVDFERTADVGGVPVSAARPSPYFYEVWGRDCVDGVVVP